MASRSCELGAQENKNEGENNLMYTGKMLSNK